MRQVRHKNENENATQTFINTSSQVTAQFVWPVNLPGQTVGEGVSSAACQSCWEHVRVLYYHFYLMQCELPLFSRSHSCSRSCSRSRYHSSRRRPSFCRRKGGASRPHPESQQVKEDYKCHKPTPFIYLSLTFMDGTGSLSRSKSSEYRSKY